MKPFQTSFPKNEQKNSFSTRKIKSPLPGESPSISISEIGRGLNHDFKLCMREREVKIQTSLSTTPFLPASPSRGRGRKRMRDGCGCGVERAEKGLGSSFLAGRTDDPMRGGNLG